MIVVPRLSIIHGLSRSFEPDNVVAPMSGEVILLVGVGFSPTIQLKLRSVVVNMPELMIIRLGIIGRFKSFQSLVTLLMLVEPRLFSVDKHRVFSVIKGWHLGVSLIWVG